MISDAIALYDLLRRIHGERKIISALFDWEGKRLEGDERLKVHKDRQTIPISGPQWWYSIEPFEDYQFIRFPVNPGGVVEDLGAADGDQNPHQDCFRYIPTPDGTIRGSEQHNVKMNFMVFAYKPSDLLSTGKDHI